MIIFLKFRRFFIPSMFILFAICLVLFSSSNLSAAQNGLTLWATSVIPSLFPFFVATELLSYTNIINILGRFFDKLMKPLFNVRGEGSFAFIMGIISGYPVGAKIACNLRESNVCSKEECERLLAFTNNSGPLFIIGTVGIKMYGNSLIGFLLLITHILACISVGICFRFWKASSPICLGSNNFQKSLSNNRANLSNLGEIISKSITNSISTVLNIGGFIVIFSVIISMLKQSHFILLLSPLLELFNIPVGFAESFILGIVEITNGIFSISAIPLRKISVNIILSSFLLGCGGISVLLQVWSIVSKTDLSIRSYVLGKILHGIFATIYTFLLILIFPIFQFDL